MPRKAKVNKQSIFEIVGGSYLQQQQQQQQQYGQQNQQQQQQQQQEPKSAGFMAPAIPVLDPLSSTIMMINSNPYIIGVFYLFLNLGGRFLSMELTKQQEQFLAQPYIRPFILFAVMFIATRNIAVAFWSTVILLSVIWVFANENHAFCLIPGWRVNKEEKNNQEKAYENNMKTLQHKDDKKVEEKKGDEHAADQHMEHAVENHAAENHDAPK